MINHQLNYSTQLARAYFSTVKNCKCSFLALFAECSKRTLTTRTSPRWRKHELRSILLHFRWIVHAKITQKLTFRGPYKNLTGSEVNFIGILAWTVHRKCSRIDRSSYFRHLGEVLVINVLLEHLAKKAKNEHLQFFFTVLK